MIIFCFLGCQKEDRIYNEQEKFATLTEIKNAEWNPLNGKFVGCGYDVLGIDVINDKTISCEFVKFNGWKKKSSVFKNNLELKNQYWEIKKKDSIQCNIFRDISNEEQIEIKLQIINPRSKFRDYQAEFNIKNEKINYHCKDFIYK